MHRLFVLTVLAATTLASPAWAIVTSDQAGSHVVSPGQPAFGFNLDGVVMVGGRRRSVCPSASARVHLFLIGMCCAPLIVSTTTPMVSSIRQWHPFPTRSCFNWREDQ